MESTIQSYPSLYALGHRAIADILTTGYVVIEEKVDGSQFSMGRTTSGELICRSKGQQLVIEAPEKMFAKGVETAKSLDLHPGWVYRGEYLQSPKHNTLAYSRAPEKNFILFDVQIGLECYLTPEDKAREAARLGIECVPRIYAGPVDQLTVEAIRGMLDRESILGGVKIEGVVIKNYGLFTPDKKIAIAKFVSEAFKEKHSREWKTGNPGQNDVVQALIGSLRTEARWNKAIQHLREEGKIAGDPRDIGSIIKEVQADISKEEEDFIKDHLYKHFWPQIARGVVHGVPEFYKSKIGILS